MDKRRVAELEVDIVSPCAQSYSLTAENAHRVTAKIICPGANAPTTPEAERILLQRGILCVPDFMANCGGVLGSTMKLAGLRQDFIRHFVEHEIGQKVTDTIKAAEKAGIPIAEYAEKVAEERFVRAKEEAEKRSITGKVFNFAVELYRNGVIPYQLVTPVAPRYFKSRLGTTQ